jgi:porin
MSSSSFGSCVVLPEPVSPQTMTTGWRSIAARISSRRALIGSAGSKKMPLGMARGYRHARHVTGAPDDLLVLPPPDQAKKFLAAALLAAAALADPAAAQSPDPEKTPVPTHGADFALVYDGEAASDVAGGAHRGTLYHGSLQAQASLDLQQLLGWHEVTSSVYGMLLHGPRPERLSSAAQGVSSISGPSGLRLDEAWLQRNFAGGRLSFLAGRYDVNSEVYRLRSAALLLNPSFGIGPEFAQSGPASVPAFPNTAAAARVQYKLTPQLVFRGAVVSARPFGGGAANAVTVGGSGVLLVSEAAYLVRPEELKRRIGRLRTGRFAEIAPYEDKVAVGVWRYSATFQDLSAVDATGQPELHHGSMGGYLLVDHRLARIPDGPTASAFLQLGAGDPRIDRFGSYVGLGVHFTGISRNRPDDQIGVGVACARNGSHYLAQQLALGTPAERRETIFEATYQAQLSQSLSLQPDVQYIAHPDTDPSLRSALNLMLRLELAY